MKNASIFKVIVFILLPCLLQVQGCLNYQNRWSQGGLGLTLAQVEDGVAIKEIRPSFDDPEASLKAGDFIIGVDGTDVSNWPKDAILDAISGPVGGHVIVSVLRDGQVISLEIERILQSDKKAQVLYSRVRNTQLVNQEPISPSTDASANGISASSHNSPTKPQELSDSVSSDASTETSTAPVEATATLPSEEDTQFDDDAAPKTKPSDNVTP